MDIAIPDESYELFYNYYILLAEENARQNICADVSAPDVIERVILDSLAPLSVPGLIPRDARVADIGSGAGLPGIPLAIARGDAAFVLIESQAKRADFLRRAVDALGLAATVENTRAETYAKTARASIDTVVCRAVSSLAVLMEYAAPLLVIGGALIAYKGPNVADETEAAVCAAEILGMSVENYINVTIPNADWSHGLAIARQISACPAKFPRREGMAEKNQRVNGIRHNLVF
ncbi:ribosomal RNA small subunit methyltransferase G [Clostridia bacterium]|nr:ribosomal RNA small subunit methyltransferase G [Clostridia bacterium]